MDWLVLILDIAVAIMCVVFETLYFKERARRFEAEMQLKLNDLLWQETCKKLNKTIDELEERIVDYKDRDEGRQNDGKNV